ncbi:MAG: alpha,4-glucan:maltose-phosphate maltosyltransferase [Actinomycetia bacterium]|nr:alpha,4-glucan:maltose-phosphate maltosyltransferase [Actinomycetes bacterium]
MQPNEPQRVAVEHAVPDVDGGEFAVKRVVGDDVTVEAVVFADGHNLVAANVEYRHANERDWRTAPMGPLGNDQWAAAFRVERAGEYRFRIVAWIDHLATWQQGFLRKVEAGQDVTLDREEGAALVEEIAKRAGERDADALETFAERLRHSSDKRTLTRLARIVELTRDYPDRAHATVRDTTSPIWVDQPLAICGAWYELFPRSTSLDRARPGTLRDVIERLPYVAELGFDVLYLPPIHPIGTTHRKGANNAREAKPGEPGSPWAIGSARGGHTAVDPDLGTLGDVQQLVRAARKQGLEVALDIAFQCSPDHPWIREHPQWFRHRPDGSIAYAENPPKKYEDIVPLDFDTEDWPALWEALADVVRFWIGHGVRVFRVDNPHTKPFPFWEWLIAEIHATNPNILFLAEAFTRPHVMHRLAKIGFSQSVTYFTWRNSKWELTEYFEELAHGPGAEYFRPNVWPNTPDILHETLQHGSRGTFMVRFVLAACLSAAYGIYGPVFELMVREAREEGSEEYLDSEKYEIHHWDLDAPWSLRHFIARVNAIRRAHPALQRNSSLRFHSVDNDQLLCWSKRSGDGSDIVLCVVNLDPWHAQAGWTHVDLGALGLDWEQPFEARDLLTEARYTWSGPDNFVSLDPRSTPAHVLALTPLGGAE